MALAEIVEHLGCVRCLGCARSGALVCANCRAALPGGTYRTRVPHVDRILAAWDYDGIARSLVLGSKLRSQRPAAQLLGRAIVETVWQRGLKAEAIAWIPGRSADIHRRGFDHAEVIARVVGHSLGLPCLRVLSRAVDSLDQTSLGASARKANLRGAFVARPSPPRIGVVDDLVTTGATLSEAGRALKAGGAHHVEGLVACSVA